MRWPEVELGEVFDIARGGSPRPIQKFITDDPDGINWVMIGDASSGSKYIERTRHKIIPEGEKKSRRVKPGDFLLTNSMSFGRPYIMKTTGCIHDGWLLLSPKSNKTDPDFFYHLLGSPTVYNRFAARAPGATVKNLNSDIVREAKVPLPPLPEQKRIAAILDKADALRRLRQQAIDRLNTLSQSIFHEMFGVDLDVLPFEPMRSVVEEFRYGTSNKSGEFGYPTLRIPNIIGGALNLEEIKTVKVTDKELDRLVLKEGDLLFVRTNGNPDYVGRSAVFRQPSSASNWDLETPWIYASYLIRARVDQTRIHPIFLQAYLSTGIARRAIRERCKTSAGQFNINTESLGSIPIPIPIYEKQQQFAEIVKSIEVRGEEFASNQWRVSELFSSVQQRAFAGEL